MSRSPSSEAHRDAVVLGAIGGAIVVLAILLARSLAGGAQSSSALAVDGGAMLLLYAGAWAWIALRRPSRRAAVAIVLLVAIAARGALAVHAPVISTDAYRYVWDGRVQAHGTNPYRYQPRAAALRPLRDKAVYPHVNRKFARTIYPPGAEAAFRVVYAVHRDSVVWTKLVFSAVDVAAIALLILFLPRFGFRPERALLYAWHPLAILEVGHSGHVDVLAVPLLLLAIVAFHGRRPGRTGLLLAAAVLVKPYALLVLPAVLPALRRGGGRLLVLLGAAVAIAYLPFLGVGRHVLGYLPGYVQEEGIASGRRFYLLGRLEDVVGRPLPIAVYGAFVVIAMLGLGLAIHRRSAASSRAVGTRALLMVVVGLVLTTPSYPWYTLLAAALLPLAEGVVLLPASAVAGLAVLLYAHTKSPSHPAWPLHVVYGGWALALAAATAVVLWRTRARPGRTESPRENRALGPPDRSPRTRAGRPQADSAQ